MDCDNCGKKLTNKMEIEYSSWLCELYCSPDCAEDRYFDYMESKPISFIDAKHIYGNDK